MSYSIVPASTFTMPALSYSIVTGSTFTMPAMNYNLQPKANGS